MPHHSLQHTLSPSTISVSDGHSQTRCCRGFAVPDTWGRVDLFEQSRNTNNYKDVCFDLKGLPQLEQPSNCSAASTPIPISAVATSDRSCTCTVFRDLQLQCTFHTCIAHTHTYARTYVRTHANIPSYATSAKLWLRCVQI